MSEGDFQSAHSTSSKKQRLGNETPSSHKNYDPFKDPENLKWGSVISNDWKDDEKYERNDEKWKIHEKQLMTKYKALKGKRGNEAKNKRAELRKTLRDHHLKKCRSRGPRERGYRIHPSSKKCNLCKGPEKSYKKDRNGNWQCKTDQRIKDKFNIPENKKGSGHILAPTGRWVMKDRADKYKYKDVQGTIRKIDLAAKSTNSRKKLFIREKKKRIAAKTAKKIQEIKGKKAKTRKSSSSHRGREKKRPRKSVTPYNQSSSMRNKIKNIEAKNKYRTKLNELLQQKRKQRMANSEINCKLRKWKMGNNPHIIEANRQKLLKMTEKACGLSDQYLNILTDIQVLKNASYKDIGDTVNIRQSAGAKKTMRRKKYKGKTKKRY